LSRFLRPLVCVLLLLSAPLLAQTAPSSSQRLDGANATMDQIEQTLARQDLSDSTLQDLRNRVDPLARTIQTVLDDETPKLTAAKARLDQLGPKPGDKDPPETADISAERDRLQKQFDDTDALLKRAKVLAVRADQLDRTLVDRRRARFADAVFSRSNSLLDPRLWIAGAADLPRDIRAAQMIATDWLASVSRSLSGVGLLLYFGGVVGILAVGLVAAQVSRRIAWRDPKVHDPSKWRRAMGAVWTTIVTIIVPIAAMMALVGLARGFDLSTPRLDPLVDAVFEGVMRISLTLGIARGLLAPDLINWRMLDLGDAMVDRLMRLALSVAIIVSAAKILEALAAITAASLPVTVLIRALGASLVAITLAGGMYGIAGQTADADDCLGPQVASTTRDWYGPMRLLAWAAVAVIIVSVVFGYVAFAAFVVDQLVWVTFIGASTFLLMQLGRESILVGLQPQKPLGRMFINSVGLRRQSLELISIVLAGLISLVLFIIAVMLILAPWGIESNDMFASVQAAIFGFKVGDVSVSLASIAFALLIVVVGWLGTRGLQRWLDVHFLPRTQLDSGLQASIRTSIGYLGIICAIAFSLGYLGLNYERVALVAGALSVGIGLGLQSIVSNFVSGLILMWERAIRVGDWIVIGAEQGHVRRINVRSTEIETFDRATVIVPNSNIMTGVVKNWVRGDKMGRIKVPVTVNTGVDPEKVRDALIEVARGHESVMKLPAPNVLFTSMAANGINLELVCFVADVETSMRITSDLNFAIFRRFREAGFELMSTNALPPVASVTGFDMLNAYLARAGDPRQTDGQAP
jgi:potassium efflux system protein